MITLLIIIGILLFQCALIGIQKSRYHHNEEGYEDYSCIQMSRDCERFFESFGIHVCHLTGWRETGEKTEIGGNKVEGHRWLLLDFGWFQIPYDSVSLMPWNPMWDGYTNVRISEGYVVGDVHFDNETDLKLWWKYE